MVVGHDSMQPQMVLAGKDIIKVGYFLPKRMLSTAGYMFASNITTLL
jgi:hypothetical protein